jgi:uncharacterized membrane protein
MPFPFSLSSQMRRSSAQAYSRAYSPRPRRIPARGGLRHAHE